MKFYLISDNIDTLTGMRLVGIVTTKLIELAPDVISEIKLKQPKPLITEIPDRHGESKIGEAIDGYVSEAIGVKL